MLHTKAVLLEEPGAGGGAAQEKPNYVLEYNRYGKASFRLVTAQNENRKPIIWKERRFEEIEMRQAARGAGLDVLKPPLTGKNAVIAV